MSQGSETPDLAPPLKEWTRILGIGCLATVAAAGGWIAWHRRHSAHAGGVLRRNRAGRNAEVARLGGRVGTTYATTAARKVFASAERREELDRSREMRNAEDIANSLGQMKGALMKIAQMAGYLDEGLPEPMRMALSQLQSQAPPMAPELAAQVIEQELGAHPDKIFVTWDPVPIAAASIGQVHRAVWKDPSGVERAVAVKVQYPGVDEAIRSDLDNTELVGTMFRAMFKGLDPKPMVAEIRARIGEELDYEREAKNQRLFADNFRGHPFIHVPDVIDQLSTGRVLTTELATGSTWNELLTWEQSERDLAAETIFRFVFRSLYRFQAFNGDPHPGNYLFEKGGRVTFLDFGLVKYFSDDELDVFKQMISSAVLKPDWDRFRAVIEEAGLLRKDAPINTQEAGEYFSHFYSFVQADDIITWSSNYASATVRQTFDRDSPIAQYASVPTSFVIIQRINLGLYALLGQLNASGNYRRIAEELWPMTSGPPSTPLGEAEAAWLATLSR